MDPPRWRLETATGCCRRPNRRRPDTSSLGFIVVTTASYVFFWRVDLLSSGVSIC